MKMRRRKVANPKRSKTPRGSDRRTPSITELQKQIAALRLELSEAREQQTASSEVNARLIGELSGRTAALQELLEYQTATSDVLKVISQSGAELVPTLDTLVSTAARICLAQSGFIFRLQHGVCRMIASFGIPAEYRDFQARNPIALDRGTLAGRTILERCAVHIEDAAADPEYTRIEAVQLGHQRTMLGVPLIREDVLIGVITLGRSRVEPFTEKQIALVATFADQAAIAIENVRLFDEVQARTRELSESLDQQTATSRSCASSAVRQVSWSRCSRPCWRTRRACVKQNSEIFSGSRTASFDLSPR